MWKISIHRYLRHFARANLCTQFRLIRLSEPVNPLSKNKPPTQRVTRDTPKGHTSSSLFVKRSENEFCWHSSGSLSFSSSKSMQLIKLFNCPRLCVPTKETICLTYFSLLRWFDYKKIFFLWKRPLPIMASILLPNLPKRERIGLRNPIW